MQDMSKNNVLMTQKHTLHSPKQKKERNITLGNIYYLLSEVGDSDKSLAHSHEHSGGSGKGTYKKERTPCAEGIVCSMQEQCLKGELFQFHSERKMSFDETNKVPSLFLLTENEKLELRDISYFRRHRH